MNGLQHSIRTYVYVLCLVAQLGGSMNARADFSHQREIIATFTHDLAPVLSRHFVENNEAYLTPLLDMLDLCEQYPSIKQNFISFLSTLDYFAQHTRTSFEPKQNSIVARFLHIVERKITDPTIQTRLEHNVSQLANYYSEQVQARNARERFIFRRNVAIGTVAAIAVAAAGYLILRNSKNEPRTPNQEIEMVKTSRTDNSPTGDSDSCDSGSDGNGSDGNSRENQLTRARARALEIAKCYRRPEELKTTEGKHL